MTEFVKQITSKFILPILVPLCIGLGSAVITSKEMNAKLDIRVATLETAVITGDLPHKVVEMRTQLDRHEKALDRDFARHEATVADISHKTEDQEKRLTRLEALFTETQALLAEIRTDVKILLRGGQQ